MTATIASIWRHPIKSVGREAVDVVDLLASETMPGDRLWAVAHEASDAQNNAWSRCSAFLRVTSSPKLAAVEARTETNGIRLSHPSRPSIVIDPDKDGAALIAWLAPLVAEGRAAPARVVPAGRGVGMTDSHYPTLSIGNLASHRVVESRFGRSLSIHRWRCNIWVDGLAPWEEFDLVGHQFRLGEAILEGCERISRCEATAANPETGNRDANILSVLDEYDHRDFTIAVKVVSGGRVAVGDRLGLA